MKQLGELFSAYKIPGFKEAHIRHVVAETLSTLLQIPITPKQIVFKEGTIYLSTPPVIKSAVQLHRDQIQETLQKEGIKVTDFK